MGQAQPGQHRERATAVGPAAHKVDLIKGARAVCTIIMAVVLMTAVLVMAMEWAGIWPPVGLHAGLLAADICLFVYVAGSWQAERMGLSSLAERVAAVEEKVQAAEAGPFDPATAELMRQINRELHDR